MAKTMRKCLFSLFLIVISYSQTNYKLECDLTINENPDTLLYLIQDIYTGINNSIVISDKLDYRIKVFDQKGKLLKVTGKRGQGPNEYVFGPADIAFSKELKRYAVLDHTSHLINLYDSDLNYIKTIKHEKPVTSVTYDKRGLLWVASPAIAQSATAITIYTPEGSVKKNIQLNNPMKDYLFNIFYLEYNEVMDKIVSVFRCRNLIQVYNNDGALYTEFSVNGVPKKLESKKMGNMSVPVNKFFCNIACDKDGFLYILGEDKSEHPKRDLYVYSINGEEKGKITVDEEIRHFHIDKKNNLYASTNENMVLKRYRITND